MRFTRGASDRAQAVWEGLQRTEQIALLARTAARFKKAPTAIAGLGHGVLKVGYGRRTSRVRGSGAAKYQDALALLAFVRRKWKGETSSRGDLQPVPKWITVRAAVSTEAKLARGTNAAAVLERLREKPPSRRVLSVGIPVDVRQLGPRPVAQAGSDTQVVHVAGQGNLIGGSACIPVRTSGGKLALLGCHHVFWRSLKMDDAAHDSTAQAATSDGVALGKPFPAFDLLPVPVEGNIDAALLDLSDAAIQAVILDPGFWGFTKAERPTTLAISHEEVETVLTSLGETAYLYPPAMDGAPRRIELEFLEFDPDCEIEYEHARVSLAEVMIFRPIGTPTQGGYSGSPVIAGGVFLGMHVAGLGSDGTPPFRSFVQPAYRMIPRGVDTQKLKLAADAIAF